ncbi:hypothetical protein HPB47_021696 [Ixodes persulcatus]|uniref:Uncharacterized protein n=1 Tax=Ixodes persulcatus TaxID=34615 RepID=A0AC60QC10_IXOPE|nr:hypothetical protein HPB47_021696 [Ixodes persulcatus]
MVLSKFPNSRELTSLERELDVLRRRIVAPGGLDVPAGQHSSGRTPHKTKSLICLPLKTPGVTVARSIKKMGHHSSDTAQFFFEDVRVPAKNIIGEEGMGFIYQMLQFQEERLAAAINTSWIIRTSAHQGSEVHPIVFDQVHRCASDVLDQRSAPSRCGFSLPNAHQENRQCAGVQSHQALRPGEGIEEVAGVADAQSIEMAILRKRTHLAAALDEFLSSSESETTSFLPSPRLPAIAAVARSARKLATVHRRAAVSPRCCTEERCALSWFKGDSGARLLERIANGDVSDVGESDEEDDTFETNACQTPEQAYDVENEEAAVEDANEDEESTPDVPCTSVIWKKKRYTPPQDTGFSARGDFAVTADETSTPLTYFSRYVSQSVFKGITEATNEYSVLTSHTNVNTSPDEVRKLVGMHDKLWKVRPFLDSIRARCLDLQLEEEVSVDEQMIPFKGQLSIKQYMRGKPTPWGVKVFALCGRSGQLYDFVIYQGQNSISDDLKKAFGLCSGVVLHLAQRIPLGLSKCPISSTKAMKKSPRGYSEECVTRDDINAVSWKDNNCVTIASNFVGIGEQKEVSRWDKEKKQHILVKQPEVIKKYNQSMGLMREVENVTLLASMAKLKCGRLLREVADSCLQYWGGMGYSHEVLVSRSFRDAQLLHRWRRRRSDADHHRQDDRLGGQVVLPPRRPVGRGSSRARGKVRVTLFPKDVSPRVYYERHASGNVLSSQTRQCVLNVYSWIRRQYQGKSVVEVINLTAAATGISVSSVYEIKRGFKRANGAVKSPSKKRPKFAEKRKRIANHDTCTLTAVRSCLHNFFRRGEIPTLEKIATRLQEDDVLTSCSGTTLYSLLKDMGFEKQKRNRNSFLIERQDIVEWRRWYLGAIGKHRAQNRKIYFQDET